jgi:hypothetical protein
MRHWDRMERLLSDALAIVHRSLAMHAARQEGEVSTLEFIQELLDHNELGLALETLCSTLHESGLPVPAPAYARLEQAGAAMDLDPITWEVLRPQVVEG